MKAIPAAPNQSTAATTLTKAVLRSADMLRLSQQSVANILGVSASTVSRMFAGNYQITPERQKEWEIAVLFVRMFRSLDAIFGHNDIALQWLNGDNLALHGKPADLIQQTEGLVRVLYYLDAHRGRI